MDYNCVFREKAANDCMLQQNMLNTRFAGLSHLYGRLLEKGVLGVLVPTSTFVSCVGWITRQKTARTPQRGQNTSQGLIKVVVTTKDQTCLPIILANFRLNHMQFLLTIILLLFLNEVIQYLSELYCPSDSKKRENLQKKMPKPGFEPGTFRSSV